MVDSIENADSKNFAATGKTDVIVGLSHMIEGHAAFMNGRWPGGQPGGFAENTTGTGSPPARVEGEHAPLTSNPPGAPTAGPHETLPTTGNPSGNPSNFPSETSPTTSNPIGGPRVVPQHRGSSTGVTIEHKHH
jgi:hypothetical protein